MNIIFHSNVLSERGVCVSIYDYAYYCREYLNLNPIIVYDLKFNNEEKSVNYFKSQFEVIGYNDFLEIEKIIEKKGIDYFYAQKYGYYDGIVSTNSKNLIHSVFSSKKEDIHGDIFAVISEWLSIKSDNIIPYVPYMINIPTHDDNLRKNLSIPDDALVIGRHGGYETFNIDFAIKSIEDILTKRKDIWFLFLNTEKKINHERCIYLDKIIDPIDKFKFINTCDAMLHARDYGETFGLAVLEFACANKQIISYDDVDLQNNHPLGGRNHFLYLKDNCFRYQNKETLDFILNNITRVNPFDTLYLNDEFSPKSVVNTFKNVFLN